MTDCFVIAETFPRLFLYNPERASDGLLGLCDHQVCCLSDFCIFHLFFLISTTYITIYNYTGSSFSHFHLDHCGALPYMSEMVGYDGPIYMTHPTKAICPILLEDFRKITVDKKGETNFFTSQMIKDCMKKVIPLNLHQTVQVQC